MTIKEHRIYKYMSEPFRVVGLTLDEIILFFAGFITFFIVEAIYTKVVALGVAVLGVYGLKRFKKIAAGFSLMSFLHWKLGIRLGLSKHCPESWKRLFLP